MPGFQEEADDKAPAKLPKPLVGIGFIVIIVLLSFYFYQNAPPNVRIPNPPLPYPNAYSYFVAAANTENYTPRDNAISIPGSPTADGGNPSLTGSQINKMAVRVSENLPAITKVREALKFQYLSPRPKPSHPPLAYFDQLHGIARFLAMDAEVKASRNDWPGSVNSSLDAMQMGVAISHGGLMIGKISGINYETIGRQPIWAAIDHLNAQQVRDAMARLRQIESDQTTFADIVQQEERFTENILIEEFKHVSWQNDAAATLGNGDTIEGDNQKLHLIPTSKRAVMQHYITYMDEVVANARLPYAVKPTISTGSKDPLNDLIGPFLDSGKAKVTACDTADSLLMTAFALRLYFIEHGSYPETLSQLVPGYLPVVPEDLFTLHQPLHYHKTSAKYLLYSVGPDGIDDGGKPVALRQGLGPSLTPDIGAADHGDIIAE